MWPTLTMFLYSATSKSNDWTETDFCSFLTIKHGKCNQFFKLKIFDFGLFVTQSNKRIYQNYLLENTFSIAARNKRISQSQIYEQS